MCNLYHHSIDNQAIFKSLTAAFFDLDAESRSRNYPPDYCGADQDGPVIVKSGETHTIRTMRWGFPGIPRNDGKRESPITNIRNLDSSWWKGLNGDYLTSADYRCLVPFDRFAEWDKASRRNAWFEITSEDPSFFAGIWRPWTGERLKSVEGKSRRQRLEDDWSLFAFLTTEPNNIVKPIHPKAMPVILTDPHEIAEWMAGGKKSLSLQRPLQNEQMKLIAS